MDRFTVAEIFEHHRIGHPKDVGVRPDRNLFVLGTHERTITIYSQQVRALNLVTAINSAERLANRDVAIVGGGLAGLTAAIACASAEANVKVYEGQELLSTFPRKGSREVYPKLFEWPRQRWTSPNAALPILNWQVNSIGNLRTQWLKEFRKATARSNLSCVEGKHVEAINEHKSGRYAVCVDNDTRTYNVVIVAAGFGAPFPAVSNGPAFWDGWDDTSIPDRGNVVVGGSGDGGIQDLLFLAVNNFSWQRVSYLLNPSPTKTRAKHQVEKLVQWVHKTELRQYGGGGNLAADYSSDRIPIVDGLVEYLQDARRTLDLRLVSRGDAYVANASPLNRVLLRHLSLTLPRIESARTWRSANTMKVLTPSTSNKTDANQRPTATSLFHVSARSMITQSTKRKTPGRIE